MTYDAEVTQRNGCKRRKGQSLYFEKVKFYNAFLLLVGFEFPSENYVILLQKPFGWRWTDFSFRNWNVNGERYTSKYKVNFLTFFKLYYPLGQQLDLFYIPGNKYTQRPSNEQLSFILFIYFFFFDVIYNFAIFRYEWIYINKFMDWCQYTLYAEVKFKSLSIVIHSIKSVQCH